MSELTYNEARQWANAIWQGVYSVSKSKDGWWKVKIHSPDGPTKWLSPDGVPHEPGQVVAIKLDELDRTLDFDEIRENK